MNKFNIIYESLMDILEKSKIDYQPISEFKSQIIDELNHLKETEDEQAIKDYLTFKYNRKILKGYPPVRQDRLIALKEACFEILGSNLEDIIKI